MSEEELDKWLKAGEVARKALGGALDRVAAGVSALELAENIESAIRAAGAQPAFPVNITIGSVAAHYSPKVGDDLYVPNNSIAKVDVGVHVDGYIADTALSVAVGRANWQLVDVARQALQAALKALRPGVNLGVVGAAVERAAREAGFKPIANLTGHLMVRYNLHAGKCIPNVSSRACGRAASEEVYAVEPFVTEGKGYVVERGEGSIYKVAGLMGTKDRELDSMLRELWRKYRGLPFSERWVYGDWGRWALEALSTLVRLRRVYRYPTLIEAGGGEVAQFEDTVILLPGRTVNTTDVLGLLRA